MDATRTVHIVDDQEAYREAICLVLEMSGFTVRTYNNAAAFLAEAPGAFGCVLTDVKMPGMDGLELLRRLRERGARLSVVVMTGQADIATAVQAMKAGAVDFLEKPFDDEQLVASVQRALEEASRLHEVVSKSEDAAARLATLTPREREVLDLLVAGRSNKEIGRELGSSPRTVEVHRARVMDKLNASSLPDLVRLVLAVQPAGI